MASTAKHGWPMVRLGDVCAVVSGGTPKTSVAEYWDGDIPWVTPADLSKLKGLEVSVGERSITQRGVDKSSAVLLPAGSVVLSSRAPIGYVAIAQVPVATNQGCKSFIPSPDIDARYLAHYLLSQKDVLQSLGTGATFKELSKTRAADIRIPLPPLDEQRRIAAILDAVAESITAVKSQLAELSVIPFSMSNQKPQLIALSELVDIRSSQVDPTSEPYLTMPHVAPNNLYSGSDEIVGVKSAAEDGVTSGKYAFKSGDILYSKIRPYLNKVSVAAYDGVCSADMYALVPRDIKLTDWIVWQLRSSRFLAYAAASSGRASIPKINRKTLGAFKVQVADPTVLERFNREQTTKKSLADSMRRKLNLFQELQESLSTRAFQGEL